MERRSKKLRRNVPQVPLHQKPYPALNLDPGETALFTIRYYGDGFPDRAKIDEIRVIE